MKKGGRKGKEDESRGACQRPDKRAEGIPSALLQGSDAKFRVVVRTIDKNTIAPSKLSSKELPRALFHLTHSAPPLPHRLPTFALLYLHTPAIACGRGGEGGASSVSCRWGVSVSETLFFLCFFFRCFPLAPPPSPPLSLLRYSLPFFFVFYSAGCAHFLLVRAVRVCGWRACATLVRQSLAKGQQRYNADIHHWCRRGGSR